MKTYQANQIVITRLIALRDKINSMSFSGDFLHHVVAFLNDENGGDAPEIADGRPVFLVVDIHTFKSHNQRDEQKCDNAHLGAWHKINRLAPLEDFGDGDGDTRIHSYTVNPRNLAKFANEN